MNGEKGENDGRWVGGGWMNGWVGEWELDGTLDGCDR